MTQANFPAIMDKVFEYEVGPDWRTGGLVDHPKDPGGLTRWGIASRSHPGVDIRNLTKAGALKIYERDYWKPCAGPDLPIGLDLVAMDGSVNSGVKRGVKWLQRGLKVKADGVAGPQTIAAAKAAPVHTAIKAATAARMGFLQGLRTFSTFGRGWSRRVADVEATAIAMTSATIPKLVREVLVVESRTANTTAKAQNQATAAPAAAGGGVAFTDLPTPALIALVALLGLAAFILWRKASHNRERAKAYQRAAERIGVNT